MSYEIAKIKAWEELLKLNPQKRLAVKFLADEYNVDAEQRKILSLSCNIPAKDFLAILLLHYLVKRIQGLPAITGQWLTFRELSGIEGYASAFRKRSLEPIIRKYGRNPQELISVLARFPGKKGEGADAAIVLEAFTAVPVLVTLWGVDKEFAPDAQMFFDQSIREIFCTEDIVVLAGIIASEL